MATNKNIQAPTQILTAGRSTLDDDASLLWIHCNRCYALYVRKECAMYLLACHHVACQRCSPPKLEDTQQQNTIRHKCPICGEIVRGCQLGNTMPRNLKELFHPHPWLEDLPNILIHKFQSKQMEHLIQRIRIGKQQLMKLMEHRENIRKRAGQTLMELDRLKNERKQLERRALQIREQNKMEEESRKKQQSSVAYDSGIHSQMRQPRFQAPGRLIQDQFGNIMRPHSFGNSSTASNLSIGNAIRAIRPQQPIISFPMKRESFIL